MVSFRRLVWSDAEYQVAWNLLLYALLDFPFDMGKNTEQESKCNGAKAYFQEVLVSVISNPFMKNVVCSKRITLRVVFEGHMYNLHWDPT